MIIPITGCMAFGKELGAGKGLQYYNFDFENKISFVYWFVSFYVFLNIAAFSVYIIVIRTNILKMIDKSIDPLKASSKILLIRRTHNNLICHYFSDNFGCQLFPPRPNPNCFGFQWRHLWHLHRLLSPDNGSLEGQETILKKAEKLHL